MRPLVGDAGERATLAFSFWIAKPLFALLSTTVNVYSPVLSVSTGFPFVVSVSLPATSTVAASLPRNATIAEPTMLFDRVPFELVAVGVVGLRPPVELVAADVAKVKTTFGCSSFRQVYVEFGAKVTA